MFRIFLWELRLFPRSPIFFSLLKFVLHAYDYASRGQKTFQKLSTCVRTALRVLTSGMVIEDAVKTRQSTALATETPSGKHEISANNGYKHKQDQRQS